MVVNYDIKHESITGSDLTGSNGEKNRTYTLANDNAKSERMIVMRAEAVLQQGVDFSFDTSTNTITFLIEVWDDNAITLDYYVDPDSTLYCSTLDIARNGGIGVEIHMENLGTGDGSEDSYDLKHGNVIAESYILYYGSSGSNDYNELTENIDYSINKDAGTILLTSSGISKINGYVLYCSYIYSPKQSDTVLNSYLAPASKEVEKMTNNYWGSVKTSIEYFDGYDPGYPQTDEPFGTQIDPYAEFTLRYKNVQSITSILFLDREGNTSNTLETSQYRLITDDDMQESRVLINTTIPNGKANVKITYTHGYSSVPNLITELTSLVASKMALVNISGGSYKDVSTYTIGRKSFSIGQIYVNIQNSIQRIQDRIDSILERLGNNYWCA